MLKYWLWLTTLPSFNNRKIPFLLRLFSTPEDVYFAMENAFSGIDGLTDDEKRALSMKSLDNAEMVLERCQRLHIRMVTLQDAEYPPQLKAIDDPPCVLYLKGQLSMLAADPAIGIVGTRGASAYGLDIAARFAYHLSKGGMTVVSGMAEGIDAAAHTGALRADCPTVAVLGSGADVIYPPKNESLYYDIVARGAVVTEYPPGTRPLRENFPRRNRIISGMSAGVLVVEAPEKSGSLITASRAIEQGRDVFAIPGSIDAPNSAGCNSLIRDCATLVTTPGDILEEYAARYAVTPMDEKAETPPMPNPAPRSKPRKPASPAPPPIDATPAQKKLLDVLRDGPANADKLIQVTGMRPQDVLAELTILEVSGVVRGNGQGVYERL